MPNVLSPRDLVSGPDNMDETVLSSSIFITRINDNQSLDEPRHEKTNVLVSELV